MSEHHWQFMFTAPRNATWIEIQLESGERIVCHWAEDLSGEDQPPFRGWFQQRESSSGYYQVEGRPEFWRHLPDEHPKSRLTYSKLYPWRKAR